MKTKRLVVAALLTTLLTAPVEAGLLDRLVPVEQVVTVVPVEQIGTVIPAEQLEEGRRRRQHIRSMHILERPNRTIHVYGNFVRYRHSQGRNILY